MLSTFVYEGILEDASLLRCRLSIFITIRYNFGSKHWPLWSPYLTMALSIVAMREFDIAR